MLCLLGARTSFLTTPTHGPEDEMASSARLARTTYGGSLTNTCASSDACKAAALAKDLTWGSAGSYTTKGCYFYDKASDSKYAGKAYYGTRSNAVEAPLTGGPKLRLTCEAAAESGEVAAAKADGEPALETCASSDACKAAALAKDLAWGSAGSYGTKACYFYEKNSGSTYAGKAYYGTRSNVAEAPLTGGPKLRLLCKTKSFTKETFTKEELDAAVAEATKDLFTQEDNEQLTAENEELTAVNVQLYADKDQLLGEKGQLLGEGSNIRCPFDPLTGV